jgi:hypothetical protein
LSRFPDRTPYSLRYSQRPNGPSAHASPLTKKVSQHDNAHRVVESLNNSRDRSRKKPSPFFLRLPSKFAPIIRDVTHAFNTRCHTLKHPRVPHSRLQKTRLSGQNKKSTRGCYRQQINNQLLQVPKGFPLSHCSKHLLTWLFREWSHGSPWIIL